VTQIHSFIKCMYTVFLGPARENFDQSAVRTSGNLFAAASANFAAALANERAYVPQRGHDLNSQNQKTCPYGRNIPVKSPKVTPFVRCGTACASVAFQ